MKTLLTWLQELAPFPDDPDLLGDTFDRLGASAHGVDDLRDLFTNDIRFLSQF